ncbi:MAG: L-histidine N(alpha)-methyltransferase [Saprospiraceae bacterium]|nr:L-histidine N(alpha)-methyltransferase [Saprospiraceae bacterium]
MTLFEKEVLEGLSGVPKRLSSRFFYDAAGDKLFQDIMRMPEYYLTDCEFEIFQTQRAEILNALPRTPFDLIELGAGDGLKTKVLLQHFLDQGRQFRYMPIDISGNVLNTLQDSLHREMPQLDVAPQQGEYFRVLAGLKDLVSRPKVVLFLGANIGNLKQADARRFLFELRDALALDDMVLIGFDLKKDPEIILSAYNDPAGITAAFNLNLLTRINREMQGDFNIDQFKHWEVYNPMSGETRSYIVSKTKQDVFVGTLNKTFHFEAWEPIEVELSLKYSRQDIDSLASDTGFSPVCFFHDKRNYFVDTLWKK